MANEPFIFTTENLLDNLDKMGAWSSYGMASEALKHYFPEEYDEDGNCDTSKEVDLLQKLGCNYWQDAIKKYHTEVGYVAPDGFNPNCVNEY
jgi:hypothetical protein